VPHPRRLDHPDGIYHVYTRGNDRQTIHGERSEFERFERALGTAAVTHGWNVEAYAVMPNHVHLVLRPNGALSVGMHQLLATYGTWWNQHRVHGGHVYEGRFKSRVVNDPRYHGHVIPYVVANPAKDGFVASAVDWPWSSYRATVGIVPAPPWLDVAAAIAACGGHERFELVVRHLSNPGASNEGRPHLDDVLDETAASIVRAHRVYGYTFREIAAALGVSEATAWRRSAR
jgi:putative transposase